MKQVSPYHDQEVSPLIMGLLAILVGNIAGFGAVIFRAMIAFVHNLMFFGHESVVYNANLHTQASPIGWLVIFVPVLGAIIVAWLVKTFAPEAKGHGVPEVIEAIHFKDGKIRPIVAIVKSLASAISIGTGGSVGREGPIVQIGSAFGSIIGSIIRMPARQRNVLIAAGAAGGIAATFNTPVGALAFAIELMLVSVSASTLLPVGLAVATATYIGRAFLGLTPSFYIPALEIPQFHLMPLDVLGVFIPFGILIGLFSTVFLRSVYWFEDLFDAMPGNYYTRHMFGMLLVGLLMYGFMRFTGHYYIQGVGYATIVDILSTVLRHPGFLLLLAAAKLLATDLTLGSGASGGIFSPSLYLGAAFGAGFGYILQWICPGMALNPIYFAIAGMAGMIGGSTGAVLTAITMVIEMTQDGNVILPIIIAVTTAYAVRKSISKESIYTLKLLRRGDVVPEGLQTAIALVQTAKDVLVPDYRMVTMTEFKNNMPVYLDEHLKDVPIILSKENKVQGILKHVVFGDDQAQQTQLDQQFITLPLHSKVPDILRAIEKHQAHYVLVTKEAHADKASDVVGVISERSIMKSHHQISYLLH